MRPWMSIQDTLGISAVWMDGRREEVLSRGLEDPLACHQIPPQTTVLASTAVRSVGLCSLLSGESWPKLFFSVLQPQAAYIKKKKNCWNESWNSGKFPEVSIKSCLRKQTLK